MTKWYCVLMDSGVVIKHSRLCGFKRSLRTARAFGEHARRFWKEYK